MLPVDFFSKPENAQIVTLLIASPLDEEEKRGWIIMLPYMKAEEKETLSKNLREELGDFENMEKRSVETLDSAIADLFKI